MAVDEYQVQRMRKALKEHISTWNEKRMFGGLCFMVDEKMCFGTFRDGMMARVNPEEIEELCKRDGASPMIHGGRPMTGFLRIEPEGFDMDDDLDFWIQKCLEYNPLAKSSKKKKK